MTERTIELSQFVYGSEDPRFTALGLDPAPDRVSRMAALVVRAASERRHRWQKGHREYSTTSIDEFRDVFVPSEIVRSPGMSAFEPALEALVADVPADFLECEDLRPVQESSAYRGAMREQTPSYCGHSFGDTIDLAIAALRGFFSWRGQELRRSVRAWAWPFLWLQYGPASVVVASDRLGDLHVIRSS